MWGHCNNNATKGGFGITNEIVWRSRLLLGPAVERIVKRFVMSNIITLMWRHCYNSGTKRDCCITNNYVTSETVRMFPLL